jgi:hypothetical protein
MDRLRKIIDAYREGAIAQTDIDWMIEEIKTLRREKRGLLNRIAEQDKILDSCDAFLED